jgi:transposase InsO family protein
VLRPPVESGQYTSNDYLEFRQTRQLRPSVGRTRVCWDNAVAESFWASLKRECLLGRSFATRAEARRAIFRWINWYNTSRVHTTLGGIPPLEWEQQYLQQAS